MRTKCPTNTLAMLLALLFALGLPSVAWAEPTAEPEQQAQVEEIPLTPMSATYKASLERGLGLSGTATRSLRQQDDGLWQLRFNVRSMVANIEESVIFRWENNQVIPLRYRYRLSGWAIRNRTNTIDFNWARGEAYGDFRGRKVTVPLQEGALDPLGFQQQLLMDLKAGKEDMVYQVVDRRGYDENRFAVLGEEMITNSLGTNRAIKLEKVRNDSKRETLMWFAPDLDYTLIRLLQVEPDGTRYEIDLDDADVRTAR
ncbi:MAG: DUF3108 domain-containing protein [Marinobacter sp.]|nr:DUF3108 domain-containing protein [Marinobacter sp.]